MNSGDNPTMAIIENHHFKAMARIVSNPRLHIRVTYDIHQFRTHQEIMWAELCPDCTAAAKAVKPGYLP